MNLIFSPALFLSVLLAIGYACLLHLWSGRNLRELLLFLLMALLGFGLGQLLGGWSQAPGQIGQVHMVEASAGAWLLLLATRVVIQ